MLENSVILEEGNKARVLCWRDLLRADVCAKVWGESEIGAPPLQYNTYHLHLKLQLNVPDVTLAKVYISMVYVAEALRVIQSLAQPWLGSLVNIVILKGPQRC